MRAWAEWLLPARWLRRSAVAGQPRLDPGSRATKGQSEPWYGPHTPGRGRRSAAPASDADRDRRGARPCSVCWRQSRSSPRQSRIGQAAVRLRARAPWSCSALDQPSSSSASSRAASNLMRRKLKYQCAPDGAIEPLGCRRAARHSTCARPIGRAPPPGPRALARNRARCRDAFCGRSPGGRARGVFGQALEHSRPWSRWAIASVWPNARLPVRRPDASSRPPARKPGMGQMVGEHFRPLGRDFRESSSSTCAIRACSCWRRLLSRLL